MGDTPVLPARYIASVGAYTLTQCPCQGGPSGYCEVGKHHRCPRETWPRHGFPAPLTHIVSRRDCAALEEVWPSGKPCRWICPCVCHTRNLSLFASPPLVHPTGRTGGNQGYLRIGNTDTAGADTNQPALWEE